jgi:hypothetical protein
MTTIRLGAAALIAASLASCTTLSPSGSSAPSIETVSTRSDLVSGGDVLVRVRLPDGADPSLARLYANGPLVAQVNASPSSQGALRPAPDGDGWFAHVGNLRDGKNDLMLTYLGRVIRLEVTNHANGGALFSGPQIQPWPCLPGATNAQCDRPPTYAYLYKSTAGGDFKPYDPAHPAPDVAQTNATGFSIPYIVRVETFTQNRSGVSIAVLFNPQQPWDAASPQRTWNHGALVLQGAGCGTGYGEQAAGSPLNDRALGRGFAVVTVALLHNTINCNPIVQAEAALMAKEHLIETYGPVEMFFGMGSSGGAISQLMDQNAYPGLYDGLILNHLFADSDASRIAAYDCRVLADAWSRPGAPAWTDAQKAAVAGMASGCAASPTRFEIYNPSVGTNCTIPDAQKFHPVNNPRGVRCTLQDYEVNQVGRRPDGYAHARLDTVGVQYGLRALMAGTITPAQFADLNASIGGHDINFTRQSARTEADRAGLARLYSTGVANTLTNLRDTPIIETRLSVTDFHQPFHAVMVRARLDRAQGGHDNYALWRTPAARDAAMMDASFDTMVAWITAINNDRRDVPRAQKVVDARPPLARDRCIVEGADASAGACPRPQELARVLAGAPDTNDSGKCQLKPLRRTDYGAVSFTDEQWTSLQRTFPAGVCDYTKPMVDYRATTPWLTYSGDGQSRPLGAAPRFR